MADLGVVGEWLATSDMAATPPTPFHRFTPTFFYEVKAFQTWVVKYGTPTMDPMTLELRAYNPVTNERTLIATSITQWQLSEIGSDNYALKQLYFEFDQPPILRKGTEYTVNLKIPNYVGTADNHIAWVHAWNDPIVAFSGALEQLSTFPFQVGIIGREVRP